MDNGYGENIKVASATLSIACGQCRGINT